jgi:hypothetical protein
MRPALLLLTCLLSVAAHAAESAAGAEPKKPVRQAKGANLLPESVDGVSAEEYAKVRRAIMLTYGDEKIAAARKHLAELKDRGRFTNGRNEAEDLRRDFEKARDAMVSATLEAVLRLDPSIEKNSVVLTLNAVEELTKKRGQEAMQKQREKEAAEAKLAKKDAPEAKETTPAAPAEAAKPLTPAQLLADVEGVSAEDMKKFRAAALVAQKDPTVKELKAKQLELRKQAEFSSADEKKGMRSEFEGLANDLRKAQLAAIGKAAPSLSKETLETIMDAVEARAKENAKKAPKAGKTPLKPFPFAEKK